MTWVVLPSSQPGDQATHTLLNKFRDNLNESYPAKASAAGLIYATGPGALAIKTFTGKAGKLVRVDDNELAVSFDGYGFLQAPLYESNDLSGANFPATTAADVVTKAITTTGGDVLVIATFEAQELKKSTGGAGLQGGIVDHTFILRRDTTDIWTVQDKSSVYTGARRSTKATFYYLDSPGGAATYTYKLRGAYIPHNTDSSYTPQCWGRMSLFELP